MKTNELGNYLEANNLFDWDVLYVYLEKDNGKKRVLLSSGDLDSLSDVTLDNLAQQVESEKQYRKDLEHG